MTLNPTQLNLSIYKQKLEDIFFTLFDITDLSVVAGH